MKALKGPFKYSLDMDIIPDGELVFILDEGGKLRHLIAAAVDGYAWILRSLGKSQRGEKQLAEEQGTQSPAARASVCVM